jgi:uncharacterized repeat protein (TIGR03806 family)
MKYKVIATLLLLLAILSCSKDDEQTQPEVPEPAESVVNVNLAEVPYDNLSDYNFFQGALADMTPQDEVLPYDLISHLFTDYAKKNRYIWMPEGVAAAYVEDSRILDFPVGSVLIKTFYYDNVQPSGDRRIMETRLLIHKEDGWIFGEYVWNDEQSEAVLETGGSFTPIQFIDDNGTLRDVNYRLPSVIGGECQTCHKKTDVPLPIGPKPQNMNKVMDYGNGPLSQFEKWQDKGFLTSSFPTISSENTVVEWEDLSQDLEKRVRSYIDINCGHCHAEGSHCDYRPMRFAYSETSIPENLGICVEPDEEIPGAGQTHIVSSADVARSMMYYRLSSTAEEVRMPLLGRSVVHEEAIEMIEEWIQSLDPPCD